MSSSTLANNFLHPFPLQRYFNFWDRVVLSEGVTDLLLLELALVLVRDKAVAELISLATEKRSLHTEKQELALDDGVSLQTAYEYSEPQLERGFDVFLFLRVVHNDLRLRFLCSLLCFEFWVNLRTSSSSVLMVVGNGVQDLLDELALVLARDKVVAKLVTEVRPLQTEKQELALDDGVSL